MNVFKKYINYELINHHTKWHESPHSVSIGAERLAFLHVNGVSKKTTKAAQEICLRGLTDSLVSSYI